MGSRKAAGSEANLDFNKRRAGCSKEQNVRLRRRVKPGVGTLQRRAGTGAEKSIPERSGGNAQCESVCAMMAQGHQQNKTVESR